MGSLPKLSKCENYNPNEAVLYLSQVIEKIEKSRIQFDSKSIYDFILRLSQSYFDYNDSYYDLICKLFKQKNLCYLLSHFLRKLIYQNDFKNETLKLLLTFLINYTFCSDKFAVEAYNSKIPIILIDYCLNVSIKSLNENEHRNLVYKCVVVIHNISRKPSNIIKHKCDEFKKVLLNFSKNTDEKLEMVSILTLSYLVDEKDVNLLDESSKTIKSLISKIQYCFDNGKNYGGYQSHELIYGLSCISCNENMKKIIDKENGIELLINILKNKKEEEIEPILRTLEHLCFDGEIRQKLKIDFQIEKVLTSFKNHTNEAVRKHYEGILWKINNKAEEFHISYKKSEVDRVTNSKKFHVFISYAWDKSDKILEIRNYLKIHEIEVWIDKEQMKGSSIEAMATGIENSKLFLISMSPSYKKSENCRHEAEYAFQIKKPMIPIILELKYKPDSWLGFILGTKVYYEFSERRNTSEVIDSLLCCITETLSNDPKKVKSIEPSQPPQVVTIKEKPKTINSIKKKPNLCEISEKWTKKDVLKWLVDSKLEHLKSYFDNVDGSLLAVMVDIRSSSPEYFNKALESQFHLNLVDVVRFHKALNNLF